MGVPIHSKIRRKIKDSINWLLVKIFNKKFNSQKIEPNSINKILLIRVNYRIGNILFMTPLIRALEKKLPHAKIDILIGANFTKPILEQMPNIDKVYTFPRKLLKHPIKLFSYIKQINSNNYDLIISPNTNSASSNIATLLLKAPIKLGFYDKNTYNATNRFVIEDKNILHEALKPLKLMEIFSGDKMQFNQFLDIAITKEETIIGKNKLLDILKMYNINYEGKKIVALFTDARFDKKLPQSWWKEFINNIKNIDKNLILVEILDPKQSNTITDSIIGIKENNLRILASQIASLDAFISCDTGPMHLASASLTPTIALFDITNPKLYGPLGKKDKSIYLKNKSIKQIAQEVVNHINSL